MLHPAAVEINIIADRAADPAELLQAPAAAALMRRDQIQKTLGFGQGLRPLLQKPDLKRAQFNCQPSFTNGGLQPIVIPLTEQRLEDRLDEAARLVPERALRIWRVYLAGCAYGFRRNWINLHQILASKPLADGSHELPWSRADLYR